MERDPIYESAGGKRARPEAVALRRWIHQRYLADQEPMPGRFRYYEAIMAEAIEKHAVEKVVSAEGGATVTAGDRMWKDALLWVREHGLVPDAWVLDRTRRLYDHTGYATVLDGIGDLLNRVLLDPWDGRWPLVVVESEASAAALEVVAIDYRVPMAPLRGQSSRSYLWNDVAPTLVDGQIVLAIVDLDKAGDDISASAHRRLERASGHHLDWRVIALTDDQADDPDHGIVKVPRRDGRDGVTRMVAETEALGAANLRAILRWHLDRLLPEPLQSAQGRERIEQDEIGHQLGITR